MADNIDIAGRAIDFMDQFEELKVYSLMAKRLLHTIDDSDGWTCPFRWSAYRQDPTSHPQERFAEDQLVPYLRTLQNRLPALLALLNETLRKCGDGCPFDDEPEAEPTEEELAAEAKRQQRSQRDHDLMTALFDLRTYSEKSDDHRRVVEEFAKMLSTDPEQAAALAENLAQAGDQVSGAEAEPSAA